MRTLLKKIFSKVQLFSYDPRLELRDPIRMKTIQKTSLLNYYGDIHSQRGQDGIISEILRRLNIEKGFFIEFGGWDGVYLSNARYLYEKGWDGCFIEGNYNKYQSILKYYNSDNIKAINSMVGFSHSKDPSSVPLDKILDKNGINKDLIDLLIIDIDGYDLEILKDLKFGPKIILIEGGFNFSPLLKKEISLEKSTKTSVGIQQPISVIFETGYETGYIPVCFLQDTYFIRKDLYNPILFPIKNDVITLYMEAFNFMNAEWRNELFQFRESNQIIREIESNYFGNFNIDPTGY